jgi:hypothetical protein
MYVNFRRIRSPFNSNSVLPIQSNSVFFFFFFFFFQLGIALAGYVLMHCFWRNDLNVSGLLSMILKLNVYQDLPKGRKRYLTKLMSIFFAKMRNLQVNKSCINDIACLERTNESRVFQSITIPECGFSDLCHVG